MSLHNNPKSAQKRKRGCDAGISIFGERTPPGLTNSPHVVKVPDLCCNALESRSEEGHGNAARRH